MNIRPFGWRDFVLLYRYRDRGLSLDTTRALIHGQASVSMDAIVPFLGTATGVYTFRCDDASPSGVPLIGQVIYPSGASNARVTFLAPESGIDMQGLSAFSDYLAAKMGEQGAFHILAELDETKPAYPLLRMAGFAIYARQHIWCLDGEAAGNVEEAAWSPCKPSDSLAVRSLYCNIVPGLVQQVEPLPKKRLSGFVLYHKGDINAYIELKYGKFGIWVQPYVHPDTEGFEQKLIYLLRNLPRRVDKPLYICIRSYQSWLESAVDALGARPGTRQAVMVRHLTLTQRVKQAYPIPAINGTHAEPTAPIAHFEKTRFGESSEAEQHPGTGAA